jgi:ssDNA-binding Zn-finger/Zn-ribbon topoisomerase 1
MPLVIKWGKHGSFIACTGYPERSSKIEEALDRVSNASHGKLKDREDIRRDWIESGQQSIYNECTKSR